MNTQTSTTETPAAPTLPCTVPWCEGCTWDATHLHIAGEVCFERMHRRSYGIWDTYQLEVSSSAGIEVFEPLFEIAQGHDVEGPKKAMSASAELLVLASIVAGETSPTHNLPI